MAKVDLLNKNIDGIAIINEKHENINSNIFELDHDTILDNNNLEIWTGSNKTGEKLIKGSDYQLDTKINTLSQEANFDVYRYVRILNLNYQNIDLYATYDTAGDFVQANDINDIYNNFVARGDINLNGHNILNVKDIDPGEKIYGIEWNKTQDSYRRLESAKGLWVPHARTKGYKDSDFDDVYPYNGIGRCNVADDLTVNAYYGDPDYIEDGSNGMVMDEIPKFYYKYEFFIAVNNDKIYRWYISELPREGFELHPSYIRNGKINDYIYIAAFEGSSSGGLLESVAGKQPVKNKTRDQFRKEAEARGPGWALLDFLSVGAYTMLYLIEYGTFNSQEEIGKGVVDKTSGKMSVDTGFTKGNKSFGDPNDGETPVSYRGMENLWGNAWKFIDGFVIKDNGYYITDDITNFNDTSAGYTRIGANNPITTNGYVDDIDEDIGFAFLPSSTSGTSSTYLTDYLNSHDASEVNVALLGGHASNALKAGLGYWFLHDVASISAANLSARLFCVRNY